jgi:hypothetical protein
MNWKEGFQERFVFDPPAEEGGTLLRPYELKTPSGGINEVIEFIEDLLQKEKEKIKAELLEIADSGEYEDMRREVEGYFRNKELMASW